jgi:hypothetical protein
MITLLLLLKEAGFSAKEARRFQGAKEESVFSAIKNKVLPEYRPEKAMKAKIKYTTPTKGFEKEYTYLVHYMVDTGFFGKEQKSLYISYGEEKTKSFIKKDLWENYFTPSFQELYKAKVIKSSIKVEEGYKQTDENLAKIKAEKDAKYSIEPKPKKRK